MNDIAIGLLIIVGWFLAVLAVSGLATIVRKARRAWLTFTHVVAQVEDVSARLADVERLTVGLRVAAGPKSSAPSRFGHRYKHGIS